MDDKSRIGSALIICGAVCVVAALGFAAILLYLLSNTTQYSPLDNRAEVFITLAFLSVLTGVAIVVLGVVVGNRQSNKTN